MSRSNRPSTIQNFSSVDTADDFEAWWNSPQDESFYLQVKCQLSLQACVLGGGGGGEGFESSRAIDRALTG